MNELVYAMGINTAVLTALAGWFMIEKIQTLRARRRADAAKAKAVEAMQRSADEVGRRIASGASIGNVMGVPDCNDPACPIHRKGDGK